MRSATTDPAVAVRPPTTQPAVWVDRRRGQAVLVAVATVAALGSAWLTPRGPLTGTEALVSTVLALGLGSLAGVATGSRWSMLATPGVFALVFEVARVGTAGPTVDGVSLTTLGVVAFVIGRGVHGLLVLLPMALGAGYGVWLAHRLGHPSAPAPGIPGRVAVALLTVAVFVLAAAVARPAATAPIVGDDGQPRPGSIAEFATVEIGGVDQSLLIRGVSTENPVLLHLAGGPGGTDTGAMRADTGLEEDFVVVTWDQRGTGKSYATSLDPVGDLTLEQAVADTLAVTDHLRGRFGQDRIYLTANSWGTIPSVLAVQQHPERFHAYVGTGQMVNNAATDRMFWEDALAWAERTGQDRLAGRIRAAGPPPYEDLLQYQHTVSYEHQWNDYPGVGELYEMPANVMVPEFSLMERVNAVRGMFDVNWFVYPQLQTHDFRRDVPRLDVPVTLVLGRHEARGRAVLATEWFEQLEAPAKELVVFEDSGHRPSFEQPADFVRVMRDVVATSSEEVRP
jgi:proline iminopeptidase